MFGRSFQLFRLFGISIRLDPSWFIVAILLTWSLAAFFFPTAYPNLATSSYWWMGGIAALGLFGSVVLHEIGHSLVAQRYGIGIRSITLFIFGGVAELDDEPRSPGAEFLVAIAGPLVSVVLALLFFGLTLLNNTLAGPSSFGGVFAYLARLNTIVVIFNMIPAFPLDGGRVLRAGLWKARGSLRKATRTTSRIGAGFGIALVVLGVLSFFVGGFVGGLWLVLIGLFLRSAAQMSYQQLLVRQALEGEPVQRFMSRQPVTVAPDLSVQEVIDRYVYQYYYKLYPVVEDDRLVGCVTLDEIRAVPEDQRARRPISAIAEACSDRNTIDANADAMEALSLMSRENPRLMVVDNGNLQGIIALRDLMSFFSLKMELGDDTEPPAGHSSQQRAAQQRRASVER